MDIDPKKLQNEYDRIYSYFKTTTEPFDFLEWDRNILRVWNNNIVVEIYHLKDLNSMLGSSWSKFREYKTEVDAGDEDIRYSPLLEFRQHFVGDLGDHAGRYVNPINVFHVGVDVS